MNLYQDIIFKTLDILRDRRNIEKLQFLRKSQYWSRERLDKWQLDKLNELLITAKENSLFYQERLKNVRLPLNSIAELENIPILTKADIRENKEEIKCKGVPENLFIPGKTGGSTGEPMHYYYDKRGRDWNRGCVYRSQEWSGTFLGEKTIQMTGSHYDETRFKKLKWKMLFSLHRYKSLPISFVTDELLEDYYKTVLKFKPTSLWGYASGIYCFANFISRKHPDTDFSFLKAIITSSETLFDHQRRKINEVFGPGKVFDHYGSREFYIASECKTHDGYHIHSEIVLLEVVDREGRQKKANELGRILVTDLTNLAFPFIRYETGDVGVLVEEKQCPCGLNLPILSKVEGRIADLVILPDRILSSPNFTILLSDYEGIEQYQIVQKSKDKLILNIIKNHKFKEDYETYIKDSFKKLAGPDIELQINYVSDIPVPLSGKRRYVISEISPDYL
jgi:phenylacetate-CoA ligase